MDIKYGEESQGVPFPLGFLFFLGGWAHNPQAVRGGWAQRSQAVNNLWITCG